MGKISTAYTISIFSYQMNKPACCAMAIWPAINRLVPLTKIFKVNPLHLRPVKIFAFIMAFLVLALSSMPCADNGNIPNEGNAKFELAKSTSQHRDQDHQQDDDCSPFCHCACCAGFSLNHLQTVIAQIPVFLGRAKASFISSDLLSIALPIWQPPQLV